MSEKTDGYQPNPEDAQVKDGQEENMLARFLKEIDFGNEDLRAKIKEIIGHPESFLGKGGTAQVYDLGDQCIKLMPNRHRDSRAGSYNLGNPVSVEFQIQDSLRSVEVRGVYTPRILSFYDGEKIAAIVMERLDAANAQMVANGKEELPESFWGGKTPEGTEDVESVLDDFFGALEDYVFEMHARGIVHGDLVPRNIMIDKKTGRPRLIDFGRSKRITKEPKLRLENEQRLMEQDMLGLEKARGVMEKYLNSRLK